MPDPLRDARLLARWEGGLDGAGLLTRGADVPGAAEAARFEAGVAARAGRKPLSQITGVREFWGRDFRVTADTLDPRPETEALIAAALADGPARRVLDLGTGTGCLLVTLLAEWPEAEGVGVDLSPAALAVAAQNVARHGVAPRVALLAGDWFAPVTGRFDLIVANPPYVPQRQWMALAPEVQRHEPRQALTPSSDPDGDGLEAYRRIAAGLGAHLAPGGRAYLEVGAPAGAEQGPSVVAILSQAGMPGARVRPDLDGRGRVVCVKCGKNSDLGADRR